MLGVAHAINEFTPRANELLLGDDRFVGLASDFVGVAVGHGAGGRMLVPRQFRDQHVPLLGVGLLVDNDIPLDAATEEATAAPHLYLHTCMLSRHHEGEGEACVALQYDF